VRVRAPTTSTTSRDVDARHSGRTRFSRAIHDTMSTVRGSGCVALLCIASASALKAPASVGIVISSCMATTTRFQPT
jgi:hypothetical protein